MLNMNFKLREPILKEPINDTVLRWSDDIQAKSAVVMGMSIALPA